MVKVEEMVGSEIRRNRMSKVIVAVFAAYHLAVILLVSNTAPYPSDFDEHQHISYVVHLLKDPRIFADTSLMFEVDENDLSKFDGPSIHLKHPTFYYHLMGLFADADGLDLAGNAARLRAVNTALSFLAVLIFLAAGRRLFREPERLLVFAAVLVLCPTAAALGGMINNDNLALLGAAVACAGLVRLLDGDDGPATALIIGAGFAAGALAKLTGGLLLGLMIAIVHVQARRELFRPGKRKALYLALLAVFAVIGMLPYLYSLHLHGTPIPRSAHLDGTGAILGWFDFLMWFLYVIGYTWSIFNIDTADMAAPILLGGLFVYGTWSTRSREPAGSLARAGLISVLVVLAINYGFNYSGHLDSGYMKGMHFRYYLPAWGAVAAGATLGVFALPWTMARRLAGGALVGLQFYGHTFPFLAAIVEAAG